MKMHTFIVDNTLANNKLIFSCLNSNIICFKCILNIWIYTEKIKNGRTALFYANYSLIISIAFLLFQMNDVVDGMTIQNVKELCSVRIAQISILDCMQCALIESKWSRWYRSLAMITVTNLLRCLWTPEVYRTSILIIIASSIWQF